ncbi:hypothetical protein ACFPRL_02115 [Pseudoclavibacter helvolus]
MARERRRGVHLRCRHSGRRRARHGALASGVSPRAQTKGRPDARIRAALLLSFLLQPARPSTCSTCRMSRSGRLT